jgi:hypothetical protein
MPDKRLHSRTYDDGMKRLALKVVVFLLLGAIVNVPVAWGLAAWMKVPPPDKQNSVWDVAKTNAFTWFINVERLTGYMRVESNFFLYQVNGVSADHDSIKPVRALVPRWCDLDWPHLMNEPNRWSGSTRVAQAWGWPLVSLWSGTDYPDGGMTQTVAFRYSIQVLEGANVRNKLPCYPCWPGFAINTVFYAAVLWLLFAAPFALRKWRRIRRGLCPKCGYDLRGSVRPHPSPLPAGKGAAVCPKCGFPSA